MSKKQIKPFSAGIQGHVAKYAEKPARKSTAPPRPKIWGKRTKNSTLKMKERWVKRPLTEGEKKWCKWWGYSKAKIERINKARKQVKFPSGVVDPYTFNQFLFELSKEAEISAKARGVKNRAELKKIREEIVQEARKKAGITVSDYWKGLWQERNPRIPQGDNYHPSVGWY